MAEEHRCQEGHLLCANNCGFFGSPATQNLCSKCFRDIRLKEEQASSAKIAVEQSFLSSSSLFSSSSSVADPSVTLTEQSRGGVRSPLVAVTTAAMEEPQKQQPSRCTACRKRVGLTGFKCRCGATFCSTHRYPEHHGCSFDYKAAGKDVIARANPLVKADKLDKI